MVKPKETLQKPRVVYTLTEACALTFTSQAAYEAYVRHHIDKCPLTVIAVYEEKEATYVRCEMIVPDMDFVKGVPVNSSKTMIIDCDTEQLLAMRYFDEPLMFDDDPRKDELRRLCALAKQKDENIGLLKSMRLEKIEDIVQYVYLQLALRMMGAARSEACAAIRTVGMEKRFGDREKHSWEYEETTKQEGITAL